MNAYRDIAQRIVNARANLVACLAESASISEADARKAADYYIKHRIVKLDAGIGRYNVAHGVYFEADVIRRAVSA